VAESRGRQGKADAEQRAKEAVLRWQVTAAAFLILFLLSFSANVYHWGYDHGLRDRSAPYTAMPQPAKRHHLRLFDQQPQPQPYPLSKGR
jgi:hypothetical protein